MKIKLLHRKPIVIQGAMAVEIEGYRKALSFPVTKQYGGYTFVIGTFDGWPVVLSETKIGMVNCATATTLAIERMKPCLILNQGIAGAHSPDLHVGDVVLSRQVVAINSFEKPLAQEGIAYKNWKHSNFYGDETIYQGEESILALFDNAKLSIGQKIQGVLGSGDVWNREWDFIAWLRSNLGTDCEDMESLAMFQVAKAFDVAAMGVRMISNNEILEEAYVPETAKKLQEFIIAQLPDLVSWAREKVEG